MINKYELSYNTIIFEGSIMNDTQRETKVLDINSAEMQMECIINTLYMYISMYYYMYEA